MCKKNRSRGQVAVRLTAVRAVHHAFPAMTSSEIAATLGLNRHMVRHYMFDEVKSVKALPAWANLLFHACGKLAANPSTAADAFERFANELRTSSP